MPPRNFQTMNPVFINGLPIMNNLGQAAQFAVSLNSYETITQSLYDSAAYPTTGVAQLTFFQQPVGSGTGVISGAAKTQEDTNMQAAGAMPAQQAFIVTSVEVDVQPGVNTTPFVAAALPSVLAAPAVATAVNDAWKIRTTGFLNFNISSKSYLTEGPLMKFPASNDFEVDGAQSDSTSPGATQNVRTLYGKATGPAYVLSPNNLLLIPTMNFAVTLNWGTLITVTSAARIFVRLMGQLMRPAQ